MKLNFKRISVWLGAACLIVSTVRTSAFALLGPVQPWMQVTNGVILPDDIGGPMALNCEYRWNVPVVTYGFDQSFLDYFGTNGVAAVESAIKILNDLPPASSLVLTNFPLISRSSKTTAASFFDLKSETLSRLLEQLGLAPPLRNTFVVHDWNPIGFNWNSSSLIFTISGMPLTFESAPVGFDPWQQNTFPGMITNYVTGFNFDPETLAPCSFVNNAEYFGNIYCGTAGRYIDLQVLRVDPVALADTGVADYSFLTGDYYSSLTRDDVGGLRYLLAATNLNYETLLPDVHGVDANGFVNGAWRPGVDKMTFVPQPTGSLPDTYRLLTNVFTDTYVVNGMVKQQQLQRVTTRPDFLFTTGNDFARTGTTNWLNNAGLNSNPTGAGPGVIQPPVVITFQKLGGFFFSIEQEEFAKDNSVFFGSFDGSTNEPVVYPVPRTGDIAMTVRVMLSHENSALNPFRTVEWSPTSQFGAVFAFQTSTNLSAWSTLFSVTNTGSLCIYESTCANSPSRFYRLQPQ